MTNTAVTESAAHAIQGEAPMRDQIVRLQEAMLPMQCEQPDLNTSSRRDVLARAYSASRMLIVGKIHKHEHFLLVLKGRAAVISEFGRMTVEAGHISNSPAGVKRIVLALEDTQFVTVHANKDDSHDLEIIEAHHIEPEILAIADRPQEVLK